MPLAQLMPEESTKLEQNLSSFGRSPHTDSQNFATATSQIRRKPPHSAKDSGILAAFLKSWECKSAFTIAVLDLAWLSNLDMLPLLSPPSDGAAATKDCWAMSV